MLIHTNIHNNATIYRSPLIIVYTESIAMSRGKLGIGILESNSVCGSYSTLTFYTPSKHLTMFIAFEQLASCFGLLDSLCASFI
jgi:hypothetical protein